LNCSQVKFGYRACITLVSNEVKKFGNEEGNFLIFFAIKEDEGGAW
jgi:hypothetical protein